MSNDAHLGVDIGFDDDGNFVLLPTGDAITVSGRDCLIQDIVSRITTPRGDLWHHPDEYGLDIYRFVQQENTPINRMDMEQAIKTEVEQDPRVISCVAKVILWDLENIRAQIGILPIDQAGCPINFVLEYNLQTIDAKVL